MKDTGRPEGAYVSVEDAGLPPFVVRLFTLERVNGNCSVDQLLVTEDEAASIIRQLQTLGVKA